MYIVQLFQKERDNEGNEFGEDKWINAGHATQLIDAQAMLERFNRPPELARIVNSEEE